jgi:DNA-binding transcriptional LysR family regulator
MLSKFARSRPGLRLDVRCELSVNVRSDLERGDLDLALMKCDVGTTEAVATWPERLSWVTSRTYPIDPRRDPVPLAVFPQGCLYRNRAIHALETAGRPWYIAYTSPNFSGIQAAVSAGLAVSILPETARLADHRSLGPKDGFPAISHTELALVVAPDAGPATRRLADMLADFCDAVDPRPRARDRLSIRKATLRR